MDILSKRAVRTVPVEPPPWLHPKAVPISVALYSFFVIKNSSIFFRSVLRLQKAKLKLPYVIIWLSSRNVFGGGGKMYCFANFFCYADFSIVFGPNFRGTKVSEGAHCLRRGDPCPLQKKASNVRVATLAWIGVPVCFSCLCVEVITQYCLICDTNFPFPLLSVAVGMFDRSVHWTHLNSSLLSHNNYSQYTGCPKTCIQL